LKIAEFDRSCTTSYQSAIVSIALYCTAFELFDVEEHGDFEIDYSSLEMATFDTSHTSCYSSSIVTMAVSCIVCIDQKSQCFNNHSM